MSRRFAAACRSSIAAMRCSLARVKDPETSRARIGRIGGELAQAPLDEDEII